MRNRSSMRSGFRAMAAMLAVFAITIGTTSAALAQKPPWPARPIELINPFPAGGASDEMSRYIAQKLGAELGQPVLVINVPGAGGSIGMQRLARAPKDGYTIGLAHSGTHVITPLVYAKVGYDPVKDFTPVAQLVDYANVLVVNASGPYKTLQDLLGAAKRNPGAINYASAGNGTSNHLSAEMLAAMSGVKFTHIPYKGSAPAMVDVLSGTVPFMFDAMSTSLPQIRSGRLRALATTGRTRERQLPDVPTVGEIVPGYLVAGWAGIMAPAGVPVEVVARLSKALEKVVNTPDALAYFASRGNVAAYGPPAHLAELVTRDLQFWAPVVKASGAKVD
ncbi:Bug family tripartite tricarboxylate transporter substrate binding protein [Variovorax paradoxus]|nr:tripartite tricarboxylate transporter substrate binding protein [Variovorax paradoxus]